MANTEKITVHPTTVNEVQAPGASIPYNLDGQKANLVMGPSGAYNFDVAVIPLKETWGSQFGLLNEKWFDGNSLLEYMIGFPARFRRLPCTGGENSVSKVFVFGAAMQSEEQEYTPAAGLVAEWSTIRPEVVSISAMAVSPGFRRLGIGRHLMSYAALMLHRDGIGIRLDTDTNERNDRVSGGWSPVHAWERWGFRQVGRIPDYGTGDQEAGDAILLSANIRQLAAPLIEGQWKDWWKAANAD